MSQQRRFAGLVVPLVTPLDAEGRVQVDQVKKVVDYVVAGGVDALFILGSTGEGPLLCDCEKQRMIAATIEAASGGPPVVVGVSETSLPRAVEAAGVAKGEGAWAVCACPPFYNYCRDQDEIVGFYMGLADAAGEAVIAYNIPSKHVLAIAPESVEKLVARGALLSMKDSGGHMATSLRFIDVSRVHDGFTVLVGTADWSALVLLGAHGAVESLANIAPRQCRALLDAALAGKVVEAREAQRELDELWDAIPPGSSLASIKAAMAEMRLCSPWPAAPGRRPDTADLDGLFDMLESRGIID